MVQSVTEDQLIFFSFQSSIPVVRHGLKNLNTVAYQYKPKDDLFHKFKHISNIPSFAFLGWSVGPISLGDDIIVRTSRFLTAPVIILLEFVMLLGINYMIELTQLNIEIFYCFTPFCNQYYSSLVFIPLCLFPNVPNLSRSR